MMKKIIYLFVLAFIFNSCEEPDNTVNFVLDNFDKGAVIRTISTSGDYNFYNQNTSVFSVEIEEHDAENGDLIADMYLEITLPAIEPFVSSKVIISDII